MKRIIAVLLFVVWQAAHADPMDEYHILIWSPKFENYVKVATMNPYANRESQREMCELIAEGLRALEQGVNVLCTAKTADLVYEFRKQGW